MKRSADNHQYQPLQGQVSSPTKELQSEKFILVTSNRCFFWISWKAAHEISSSENQMSVTQPHTHPAITTPSQEWTSQRTFPSSYCSWLTAPMRFCTERWDMILVPQDIHRPRQLVLQGQLLGIATDKRQGSWEGRHIYFLLAAWNFYIWKRRRKKLSLFTITHNP